MFWAALIMLVASGVIQKANDLAAMRHIHLSQRNRHELFNIIDAPVEMPGWFVFFNGMSLLLRGFGLVLLLVACIRWLFS